MAIITQLHPAPSEGAILSKAGFRAAKALGLSQKTLGDVIGVSSATVSRMKDGGFALNGKPFELASYLIRIYRSLDAIVGGDRAAMKSWMAANNRDLRGVPKGLVVNSAGLINVMNYLDAQRAPL
ncbi:MAG: MbcA/ParS/Xre antitoxin family protein [Paracoccaceae bacterium]